MAKKGLFARLDRTFQKYFPNAYYNLVQKPRLATQFKTERQLVRGVSLSNSAHRSIVFFTTQKCASRYVSGLLARLAEAEGMAHADFDAYVAMNKLEVAENPFKPDGAQKQAFHLSGYYYGPIGNYKRLADLEDYLLFLQLRDPRDVLTSLYFSTAYSHALINRKMIRRRKEALKLSIDDYVLENAEMYRRIYQRYCDKLLSLPQTLFLKYELMVADFPAWLDQLATHLNLDQQTPLLQQFKQDADFNVKGEDIYSQRRQVTPGDHKRKLKPETINQLNEIFGPVMKTLGYKT